MSYLKDKLFRQRNIGKQWGIIAQVAAQAAIFISIINLFLIAVTAYNTTICGWLAERGIYIQFWVFAAIIIGFLAIVFTLLYKFALPSFYSFWNDQFYRHDNLLRKDIELLKKDNREILKRLEELRKK